MDRACERVGLPEVLIGSLIDDRYKIRRLLGSGNFGYVYEAEHEIFGHVMRRVAFKLLKQPGLARSEVAENFSDALAAARIAEHHRASPHVQHIVAVLDAGVCAAWEDRGYVVMEFVQGDLRNELTPYPKRQLPVGLALDYARQICRGLALAHGMEPPVIHRDLKPANILIGSRGEAKVSDFGLAKAVGYLSRDAEGAGDLFCQAPESLAGMATTASDVYSLGLTLYEMLAGAHPFHDMTMATGTGDSGRDAVRRHVQRRREPIRELSECNPQLTLLPDLREVVQRCLQPEPTRRYPDAGALLAALDSVGRSKSSGTGTSGRTPAGPVAPPTDCRHLLEQSLLSEQQGNLHSALDFAERVRREADLTHDRTYAGEALYRSGHLKARLGRTNEALDDLYRAQIEFHHREATRLRVKLVREGTRA